MKESLVEQRGVMQNTGESCRGEERSATQNLEFSRVSEIEVEKNLF